jgi:hypothetical protein
VLRCVPHPKVSLTAINPWQEVPRAIKLGKVQLVRCGNEVVGGVIIIRGWSVAVSTAPRRLIMYGRLHSGEGNLQCGLLLFLISQALVQSRELVSQWLQGPHNFFNGGQLTNNIGQCNRLIRILPRARTNNRSVTHGRQRRTWASGYQDVMGWGNRGNRGNSLMKVVFERCSRARA